MLKHANPVILVHGSHIPAKKLCEKAECLHCALDHNLWLSELHLTSVFTMARFFQVLVGAEEADGFEVHLLDGSPSV